MLVARVPLNNWEVVRMPRVTLLLRRGLMVISLLLSAPSFCFQSFSGIFRCADGSMFFAAGEPSSAKLTAFDKSSDLAIMSAESGLRYGNEDLTLTIKENTAEVQLKNKVVFRECKLTHHDPPQGSKTTAAPTPIEPTSRTGIITGTANYEERISLRPTTVLVVQLRERMPLDRSANLIAEQIYPVKHSPRRPKRAVPIPFKLEYNSDAIRFSSLYQVSARIEDRGRLLLATDTPIPVITGYPNRADLVLKRVQP